MSISIAPEVLKTPTPTKIATKNGMILIAILKPFFAPSIKQLYTLIFLITPRIKKRQMMANKIKLLIKELTDFNVVGSKLLK